MSSRGIILAQEAHKKRKAYLAQIREQWEIIDAARHEIITILDKELGAGIGQWHAVPDEWECSKSPFGLCIYHKTKDPAWDSCIYCGEPYERK